MHRTLYGIRCHSLRRRERRLAGFRFFCGLLFLSAASAAAADDLKTLQLPQEDHEEITQLMGTDIVLQALPAGPLLPASAYLPKATALTFLVKAKGKQPYTETHRITPVSQANSQATFQYDKSGKGVMTFVPLGADGLAVSQETDLDKEVISTFTPPEPLIISGLAPGQSKEQTIAVSVADIAKPTKVDYTGTLDIIYTYLGRFKIKVPAGTYDADLLKWTYSGGVGPASVKTAEYRFIAKDAGMVAMVQWRSISAVLIYHERSRIARQLQSAGQ